MKVFVYLGYPDDYYFQGYIVVAEDIESATNQIIKTYIEDYMESPWDKTSVKSPYFIYSTNEDVVHPAWLDYLNTSHDKSQTTVQWGEDGEDNNFLLFRKWLRFYLRELDLTKPIVIMDEHTG